MVNLQARIVETKSIPRWTHPAVVLYLARAFGPDSSGRRSDDSKPKRVFVGLLPT